MPAKRGELWMRVGKPIHARKDASNRRGRAEFADLLVAEYVRLYAQMRLEFNLPEDIVP